MFLIGGDPGDNGFGLGIVCFWVPLGLDLGQGVTDSPTHHLCDPDSGSLTWMSTTSESCSSGCYPNYLLRRSWSYDYHGNRRFRPKLKRTSQRRQEKITKKFMF